MSHAAGDYALVKYSTGNKITIDDLRNDPVDFYPAFWYDRGKEKHDLPDRSIGFGRSQKGWYLLMENVTYIDHPLVPGSQDLHVKKEDHRNK